MNKTDREALVDELMSISDFGQAINEPYIQMAAERCLMLLDAEDYLNEEEDLEE